MKKFELPDLICFLPIIFFLFATFPYWGQAPSMDAMVIFRESTQFSTSGLQEILETGSRVHPPLIYILNNLFFMIFGKNPGSYNLLGLFIFSGSCIILYFLAKDLFGRKMAIPLILLIFCNPLVIFNSFYPANDMLILAGIIIAAASYIYGKKLYLALILSLMILMKETALVVILSFFLVILFQNIKKHLFDLLIFIPALIVLIAWRLYLNFLGTTEWQESLFVKTQDNSFILIAKKIFSLDIFDIYLKQNLYNAFILNFQWVYAILFLIIFILIREDKIIMTSKQKEFFYIFLATGFSYILLVFTFPTWTVPRYTLPVLLCFFSLFAIFLSYLPYKKIYLAIIGIISVLIIVSNFFSLDFISFQKGTTDVLGEKFYNIDFWNSGPDRMIYNLQSLKITKRQDSIIKDAVNQNADLIITDCNEFKLGEKVWSISVHNEFYPDLKLNKKIDCINNFEVNKPEIKLRLANKSVYYPN